MITKEQLRQAGFEPWFDKSETLWTFDMDRILYNIKEQTLYDADEVYGDHEKLCRVQDIEELRELVYSYFQVEIQ
jgi:hypothetical protein